MKNKLFLIPILIATFSCVSPQRYQRIVSEKSKEILAVKPKVGSNNIVVITDKLPAQDSIVNVKRLNYIFIPAIFFWLVENTLKCELSPKIVGEKISSVIISNPKLPEMLNGRELELNIEKVPSTFVYSLREYVVFVFIYAITGGSETIEPLRVDLKISYVITESNGEKKKGSIGIKDKTPANLNIMRSTKKFTWIYLEDYEISLNEMSNEFSKKMVMILKQE